MKNAIRALALVAALGLAGCSWSINPLASVTNPVNTTNLYQAELVFDGSLKTFNELKGLCANRVLPWSMRPWTCSCPTAATRLCSLPSWSSASPRRG